MSAPLLVAHRGFSGAHPEQTLAAYRAAVAWSAATRTPLALECDVRFTADDHLVCHHDLRLDRTSGAVGPLADRTLAELKALDFGSWRRGDAGPDERSLVSLVELLDLVTAGRRRGVPVGLVIETKHPNPRELEVEERVAELLHSYGWAGKDAPCAVVSFYAPGVAQLAKLLPHTERRFIIEKRLGPWADGRLPAGATGVAIELRLLRADPGYVARVHARGYSVHPWTLNRPADVAFCLDLDVDGLTSDVPELVGPLFSGRSAA